MSKDIPERCLVPPSDFAKQLMAAAAGKSLDQFFAGVRSSVDAHAKRKNYTDQGPDGENKMLVVMKALGIDVPHGIGEIIYKCAEYLRAPRRVLLEKVAGWAFVVWREHPDQ